MKEEEYIEKNKAAWNAKTPLHIQSDFYNQQDFLEGKNTLQSIELDLLGDVKGKKILHLQCHFGQDSLSLARMGASVVGVDFSEVAISYAQKSAEDLALDAQFICCNLYDLPQHLHETFDIVFTSYGTIGWLPDIQAWGKLVASYVKPQGQFVFVEFHPVVWMFDNDFSKIEYAYFKEDPIIEIEEGTYAEKEAPIRYETISWNHGLAEVLQSLLPHGLKLHTFQEFDYSPYDHCFRIAHLGHKIPMVYALKAIKE